MYTKWLLQVQCINLTPAQFCSLDGVQRFCGDDVCHRGRLPAAVGSRCVWSLQRKEMVFDSGKKKNCFICLYFYSLCVLLYPCFGSAIYLSVCMRVCVVCSRDGSSQSDNNHSNSTKLPRLLRGMVLRCLL